ncbi:hypothetical protein [Paenibacillus lemnae]|uniref:Exosporium protein C n=1 Tax=Paenibacillus lemnae TaxID=1330551 RepID=A0A848M942_PAELE|nr:hypothetical protein [Paenibacillus lemnae]NMO97185.1 hypothetical protein [Paenibacillus lemnae]
MAKRFLDAQLSLANNGTVTGTTAVTTTPTLIFTLGLDLAAAGTRAQVHFAGTVGLTIAAAETITLVVTRGIGGPIIYEVVQEYEDPGENEAEVVLTFTGADYLPPAAFTVYQVLISGAANTTAIEVGPLSFTAAGYSD